MLKKMNASRIQWFSLIRTVGVCLVLGYHFFPDSLHGGFIGVDVFFVFSGYLMTALALRQFESDGRFRVRQFYMKRILRIIPPLFLSVLLTLPFALMLDSEFLVQLGRRISATIAFVRNYYEIVKGGSYEDNLFPKLYVHTWSLSVEMQLYLVWGAILAILSRIAAHSSNKFRILKIMTAAAAMLLAALSYWQMQQMYQPEADPAAAYYATHSHAFPFLIGSAFACAVGISRFKRRELFASAAGRLAGVFVVLVSLGGLTLLARRLAYADVETYRFGFITASGLAVMLIFSARILHEAFPNRGEPPVFTFISEHSYYIYLFHWPIYIVVKNSAAERIKWISSMPAGTAETVVAVFVIVLTLIASALCMRVFEPFLVGRTPNLRTRGKVLAGIPLIISFVLCVFVVSSAPVISPMSSRFSDEYLKGDVRAMANYDSLADSTPASGAASETAPVPSISTPPTMVPVVPVAVMESVPQPSFFDVMASIQPSVPTPAVEPSPVPTIPLHIPSLSTEKAKIPAPLMTPSAMPTQALPPIGTITILGDSVILGAKTQLETGVDRCTVDATVSRNLQQGPDLLREYIKKGKLGDTVVIALGTNGSRHFESLITEMIEALPDGHRIVFITPYDGRWTSSWASYKTTAYLRSIDGMYPYITIGDWAAVVSGHNDWLTSDKVHLRNNATITTYANVVKDSITAAANTPVKGGFEPAVAASARIEASAAALAAGLPDDVLVNTKREGVIATSGNPLNIRADASIDGEYLGQVPHGKVIECYETIKSKLWLYILYGDLWGYGSAQYVKR